MRAMVRKRAMAQARRVRSMVYRPRAARPRGVRRPSFRRSYK